MRRHLVVALVIVTAFAVGAPAPAYSQGGASPALSGAAGGSVRGDFNGDHFADLAVGIPHRAVDAQAGSGAVNVLYGSAQGLRAANTQMLNEKNTFGSARADERFGSVLAAGDFNGDGFADLAIGIPYRDANDASAQPQADSGAVLVLRGSAKGLTAKRRQVVTMTVIFRDSGGCSDDSAQKGAHFGSALAAGNLGNGPQADLAVGVPDQGLGVGAADVVYGSPTGLASKGCSEITLGHAWLGPSPGASFATPGEAEKDDHVGVAVAIGDFGHGAPADIAVGAPIDRIGGGSNPTQGSVIVLYGSSNGLTSDDAQLLSLPGGADPDEFGFSLAAGNVGRGQQADLAVGIPQRTVGGKILAGAVDVFYGGASGLANTGTIWTRNHPNIPGGPQVGEHYGQALAVGNFGHSGEGDLAIGMPNHKCGTVFYAGGVQVLYGTPSGLRAIHNQLWTPDTTGVLGKCRRGAYFGWSLFAANFGHGGSADLAIGSPARSTTADFVHIGAVNVLYGSTAGLSAAGNQIWNQNSPGIPGTTRAGDEYGFSAG